MQAQVVREHVGIAEECKIVTCVAPGLLRRGFHRKSVKSTRVSLDKTTIFVRFPGGKEVAASSQRLCEARVIVSVAPAQLRGEQ